MPVVTDRQTDDNDDGEQKQKRMNGKTEGGRRRDGRRGAENDDGSEDADNGRKEAYLFVHV